MAIYFIILGICPILEKINDKIKIKIAGKQKSFFSFLSLLILLFFATFRAGIIGKDTFYYEIYFFQALEKNIFELPYEIGFNIITKCFQIISNNFELYLSFLSIVTLVPMLKILRLEIEKHYWLIIYIFIATQYVNSFSILRNYLAIMFLLVAYHYMGEDGRRKEFWIYSILAILAHYSSIIYLILFFLCKKIYKKITYIIAILLAVILYIPKVATTVRGMLIKVLSIIRPQYSYFTVEYVENPSMVFIGIYAIICFLSFLYYRRLQNENNKNIVLINLTFFMMIFNLSMSWFPAFTRISSISLIFSTMLIPKIIQCEKSAIMRLILKIFFCLIFLLYMVLNISVTYGTYKFR